MSSLAIHVILDASGSMASVKNDTLGGLNEYFATIGKDSPEAKLWLTAFNSHAIDTIVHGSLAKFLKPLNLIHYTPRGWTPLYDAIGKTITTLEATEAENKVLVILTDGLENASTEYTKDTIKKNSRREAGQRELACPISRCQSGCLCRRW